MKQTNAPEGMTLLRHQRPERLLAAARADVARIGLAMGEALMRGYGAPALLAWCLAVENLPARPEGSGGTDRPDQSDQSDPSEGAGLLAHAGLARARRMVELAAAEPAPDGIDPVTKRRLTERRLVSALLAGLASAGGILARAELREAGPGGDGLGPLGEDVFAGPPAELLADALLSAGGRGRALAAVWHSLPAVPQAEAAEGMLERLLTGQSAALLGPARIGMIRSIVAGTPQEMTDLEAGSGRSAAARERALLGKWLAAALKREAREAAARAADAELLATPAAAALCARALVSAVLRGRIRVIDAVTGRAESQRRSAARILLAKRRERLRRAGFAGGARAAEGVGGSAQRRGLEPRLWVAADGLFLEWPAAAGAVLEGLSEAAVAGLGNDDLRPDAGAVLGLLVREGFARPADAEAGVPGVIEIKAPRFGVERRDAQERISATSGKAGDDASEPVFALAEEKGESSGTGGPAGSGPSESDDSDADPDPDVVEAVRLVAAPVLVAAIALASERCAAHLSPRARSGAADARPPRLRPFDRRMLPETADPDAARSLVEISRATGPRLQWRFAADAALRLGPAGRALLSAIERELLGRVAPESAACPEGLFIDEGLLIRVFGTRSALADAGRAIAAAEGVLLPSGILAPASEAALPTGIRFAQEAGAKGFAPGTLGIVVARSALAPVRAWPDGASEPFDEAALGWKRAAERSGEEG